ncbi:MAG: 50S ribosomal protein L23, partial [cyanobacterium endosymbiont of Rhopalodia inflata]
MTKYDHRNLADLILKPIVTEKATLLLEDNKYVFEVALRSNKSQIKAAIE